MTGPDITRILLWTCGIIIAVAALVAVVGEWPL